MRTFFIDEILFYSLFSYYCTSINVSSLTKLWLWQKVLSSNKTSPQENPLPLRHIFPYYLSMVFKMMFHINKQWVFRPPSVISNNVEHFTTTWMTSHSSIRKTRAEPLLRKWQTIAISKLIDPFSILYFARFAITHFVHPVCSYFYLMSFALSFVSMCNACCFFISKVVYNVMFDFFFSLWRSNHRIIYIVFPFRGLSIRFNR